MSRTDKLRAAARFLQESPYALLPQALDRMAACEGMSYYECEPDCGCRIEEEWWEYDNDCSHRMFSIERPSDRHEVTEEFWDGRTETFFVSTLRAVNIRWVDGLEEEDGWPGTYQEWRSDSPGWLWENADAFPDLYGSVEEVETMYRFDGIVIIDEVQDAEQCRSAMERFLEEADEDPMLIRGVDEAEEE